MGFFYTEINVSYFSFNLKKKTILYPTNTHTKLKKDTRDIEMRGWNRPPPKNMFSKLSNKLSYTIIKLIKYWTFCLNQIILPLPWFLGIIFKKFVAIFCSYLEKKKLSIVVVSLVKRNLNERISIGCFFKKKKILTRFWLSQKQDKKKNFAVKFINCLSFWQQVFVLPFFFYLSSSVSVIHLYSIIYLLSWWYHLLILVSLIFLHLHYYINDYKVDSWRDT